LPNERCSWGFEPRYQSNLGYMMWSYHSVIAGETGLQGCDTVSVLDEVNTVKYTIVHSGVPRNFVFGGGGGGGKNFFWGGEEGGGGGREVDQS